MSVQTIRVAEGFGSLVGAAAHGLPRAPKTIEDTGLDQTFLVELAAKALFLRGQSSLAALCDHLKLPASVLETLLDFMRGERLCEVVRRGAHEGDVHYQLTDTGRERAAHCMQRLAYAGAAPVSLADYCEMVEAQSVSGLQVTRERIRDAYADLVIDEALLDQVGAAMNSGRALFIYGPAGSGKTYLAERLSRLLVGEIVLPYAVCVAGEVIQLYDPIVHRAVDELPGAEDSVERAVVADLRWLRCRRPVVLSGGELRLSMLDLDFDASTRYYQAPPHVKANNGLYIVDDLGRQQVRVPDLLNRWIVPLDRRIDYLSLRTGQKFSVPFDVVVVFSTNLRPADLVDDAFLRRIGHKIRFAPMSEANYRAIFENECAALGVPYSQPAFDYLLRECHARTGRPLLACYPRDLLSQVRDFARYEGSPPALTPESVDRAWNNYFIQE